MIVEMHPRLLIEVN